MKKYVVFCTIWLRIQNGQFEKLKEEGFDDEIIEALRCVTRLPNENYEEFIARIITNPLAIKIKLNELER